MDERRLAVNENNKLKGFFKVYRSIVDWQWSEDDTVAWIFIKLLAIVNYEDSVWCSITVKRGETIGSIASLCGRLRTTKKKLRRAINCLEETGEITVEVKKNSYHLIKINNYNEYQCIKPVRSKKANARDNKGDTIKKDNKLSNSKELESVEKKEKSGLTVAPGGAPPAPQVRDVRRLTEQLGGTAYIASDFYSLYEKKGFPLDWKKQLERFVESKLKERTEYAKK